VDSGQWTVVGVVMSSKGVKGKLELRLVALEEEFHATLVSALERCRDGGEGVFLSPQSAEQRGGIWKFKKTTTKDGKEINEVKDVQMLQ